MNTRRPVYREPWMWLVIGIPLLTLFAGYQTLRLAYQSGASDTVPDDVTRTGQVQTVELAPDREAARLGLHFLIAIDPVNGRIEATQDAGNRLHGQLIELDFVHPLRAGEDRAVRLLPAGSHWQATMPRVIDSNWQLVLRDADSHWRLIGRMPLHALSTTMQPALPP